MAGITPISTNGTHNESVTLNLKITVDVKDLIARNEQPKPMTTRTIIEALTGKTAEQVVQESKQG